MRRTNLLLLSLLTLVAVASLPASASRSDAVVIGAATEPDLLLGPFSALGVSHEVLASLFVSMIQLDDRWKPSPRAEKVPALRDGDWQILPNGKMRVVYKPKRGYTWHDGRGTKAGAGRDRAGGI